jgi:hypothetical protein
MPRKHKTKDKKMNTKQMNQLAMFDAVHAFLDKTVPSTPVAGLTQKVTLLGTKLEDLAALAQIQAQHLKASVYDRNEALGAMTRRAIDLSGIALCYADEHKLGSLAIKARVRASDLLKFRKARSVQIAQQLHDAILPVVAELAAYGVTPATLEAFQAAIDRAEKAVSGPRNAVGATKAATAQLHRTVQEIATLLKNQIDGLVFTVRETDPRYYAHYRAARSIVDRPGVRSPVETFPVTATAPAPAVALAA